MFIKDIIDKWTGVDRLEKQIDELKHSNDEISDYINEELAEQIQEAVVVTAQSSESDRGWTNLGDNAGLYKRDLPLTKHQKQVESSWDAFLHNPLAWRIIHVIANMVVGRDMVVDSEEPDVKLHIDRVINSRKNRLKFNQRMFMNRLLLDGECFLLFEVDAANNITIRDIESKEITDILYDPYDDYNTPLWFVRKRRIQKATLSKGQSVATKVTNSVVEVIPSLDIIDDNWNVRTHLLCRADVPWEATAPSRFIAPSDKTDGSTSSHQRITSLTRGQQDIKALIRNAKWRRFVFHIKNPLISTRSRGLPFLSSILRWLKEDEILKTYRIIVNKYRSANVLDIEVQGGREDVEKIRKQLRRYPPRPGQINIHSNRFKYDYKAPNLGAGEAAGDLRFIQLMAVHGSLLPEPIATGNVEYAGQAPSNETKFTFVRIMEAMQATWEYAYRYGIIFFILYVGVKLRKELQPTYTVETEEIDDKGEVKKVDKPIIDVISINFPALDTEDLPGTINALSGALMAGIMSKHTAASKLNLNFKDEMALIQLERLAATRHEAKLLERQNELGTLPAQLEDKGEGGGKGGGIPML